MMTFFCLLSIVSMVWLMQVREGWRGIVPLRSKKETVERLLGRPTRSHGVSATYETDKERVLVFYSGGPCKKEVSSDWNVPSGTVLSLTVHPNSKLLLEDLHIEKKRFERVLDPHSDRIVYYISKEDGVRIEARLSQEGEDVDNITFEPAMKDLRFKCRCD